MHNKPVIGLAGGIGSGKSEVARILGDLGCVVTDSDAAARAALDDPHIKERIVQEFGEDVLHEPPHKSEQSEAGQRPAERRPGLRPPIGERAIDRSALAHIVFSDPAKRRVLESIVHPWVEHRRIEQFAQAPADAPALVIDAPLLYEAGLDRQCDAVIFVDAPREIRLERVRRGRGWDEAELDRRERSQMPLDEKRQMADHVLTNTGSVRDLAEQTRRILATIVHARRNL